MTQQTENSPQPGGERVYKPYPRLRGLALLLIGLGFAKWQIYDALHAAENGATEVTMSSMMMALAVIFPVMGLAMMLAGHGVEKFFVDMRTDPKRLNAKSVVFLLVTAGVAGGAWICLKMALRAQGYH